MAIQQYLYDSVSKLRLAYGLLVLQVTGEGQGTLQGSWRMVRAACSEPWLATVPEEQSPSHEQGWA